VTATDIVTRVSAALPGVPAWSALHAVLGTLGEVLPYGTAGYLAANLPAPVGAAVGRHFPVDDQLATVSRAEFLGAVSRRSGCPLEATEPVVRAVLGAVAESVPLGVLVDVQAVLPAPLVDLVPVEVRS
jgi:uncharacterized protein (DUF2267 family)